MTRPENPPSRHATLVALLLAGAVLFAGAAAADGRGVCYTATIDAPVVLPDGSAHPPGQLRLCSTRSLSPVSWLHKTSIDGKPIAMFTSRVGTGEALIEGATAVFVFRQRRGGPLTLVGYASTHRDQMRTYDFVLRGRVTSDWRVAEANRTPADEEGSWVLIAAHRS